ncbi:MAG: FAD-dependent oxidoreductase [archaeon]
MKDIIIVGGSGAGVTAGIYSARSGLNTMLITESFGGQLLLTEKIENYSGFKSISGFDLSMKLREHLKSYKEIEVLEGVNVTGIERKGKNFVVTAGKKEFESKAVIIATGRRPRKLSVKGSEKLENKGIHYCAVCDGPLYKGQNVAVIGGGYSGVEEALYLSNIAKKVFIIETGKQLGGEEITRKEVLLKKNVEVITEAQLSEVSGEKTTEGIKYKKDSEEKSLSVKAVFVNIGEIPNSDFVSIAEKNQRNEIKINSRNETSIPGLFAAGDVTDIPVHQLIVVAGEGCKAAINANDYLNKLK